MKHERLKHEIETALGHPLNVSADYEDLSKSLYNRHHVLLSPTTLKRIFGYLNENVNPRRSTLDILAKFVGYRSFEDFNQGHNEPQSNPVMSTKLCSDDLTPGMMVRIKWLPDRVCTARYLGDGRFMMVEAANTKLNVGDTFSCHLIIEHEPLYLSDLKHGADSPTAYVAGKINGVTFEVLAPSDDQ